MNFDELSRIDREHYWHAFTQMSEYQPFIIERGEGVWLYGCDGRRYLDGVSSLWCNVHGHRHPHIDAAIRQQLDKIAQVTSLGMSNPTTLHLTQRLVNLSPGSLECVFFSSDGSSAVEVALKLAFQYWRQCEHPQPKRDLYMAVGAAYHGDTLGSCSVGGVSRFHAMFAPLLFDVIRGPVPDSYRRPELTTTEAASSASMQLDDAREAYLAEYRELFERFGERIAAVIIEPMVQGAAGMVMHPPGFCKGLRELAREYGALFIADEIAVGMGRTGRLWASEWEELEPDFLCTGKGLSGGYLPLAATLTSRRVWNAFLGDYAASKSFFHGHTYGGNPLACAAGVACLEVFEQEKTLNNVLDMGAQLGELLQPLREHPNVGDVRRLGLMAAVELVSDKARKQPFPWVARKGQAVCNRALEHGVWLRPLGNVVVIMPPLSIKSEELHALVDAVREGLSAV